MKKLQILAIVAISSIFASCYPVTDTTEPTETEKVYNVAVILDGTDRIQNMNGISNVDRTELIELAKMIAANGTGSLFVSYVDRDCSNNHYALFEFWEQMPKKPGKKKEYIMHNSYQKQVQNYEEAVLQYQKKLTEALDRFSFGCDKVYKHAYSDKTASETYGSDVYGAVNKALKATAVYDKSDIGYVILVSDCCHNANTTGLAEIPENIELLAVNTNDNDSLKELISRRFLTFSQVLNFIF